eukprot:382475-Prymnesium_polylepis.2
MLWWDEGRGWRLDAHVNTRRRAAARGDVREHCLRTTTESCASCVRRGVELMRSPCSCPRERGCGTW